MRMKKLSDARGYIGKGLPDGPTPRAEPNQFGNRKERRAWLKQERIANMSRKSVRTVSGGLPSLGRKR